MSAKGTGRYLRSLGYLAREGGEHFYYGQLSELDMTKQLN